MISVRNKDVLPSRCSSSNILTCILKTSLLIFLSYRFHSTSTFNLRLHDQNIQNHSQFEGIQKNLSLTIGQTRYHELLWVAHHPRRPLLPASRTEPSFTAAIPTYPISATSRIRRPDTFDSPARRTWGSLARGKHLCLRRPSSRTHVVVDRKRRNLSRR